MTKKTANGVTHFLASVPTYQKRKILDTFMDDNGNKMYVLDNGNTANAEIYDSIFSPPKGTINWKTKGENPDKTKIQF